MLYLLLAIASSAMVSICMRMSEKYIKNEMGMFTANYVICFLLSVAFMNYRAMSTMDEAIPIVVFGILSGILYLAGFVFLKINMKYNGMVMASTFMKLGVLIPILMAVVIYHEMPNGTQVLGIVLSIGAIIMIHFEREALQESKRKIWLLALLILSGFTDSMANIYEKTGSSIGKDAYLAVTFFTAFLLALMFVLLNKNKIEKKDIFFGMLIGIPNYFSARFLLLALGKVPAVLVYPMYSVATMVVLTIVGVFIFHENISKKKAVALGIIVLALCLLQNSNS